MSHSASPTRSGTSKGFRRAAAAGHKLGHLSHGRLPNQAQAWRAVAPRSVRSQRGPDEGYISVASLAPSRRSAPASLLVAGGGRLRCATTQDANDGLDQRRSPLRAEAAGAAGPSERAGVSTRCSRRGGIGDVVASHRGSAQSTTPSRSAKAATGERPRRAVTSIHAPAIAAGGEAPGVREGAAASDRALRGSAPRPPAF